MIRNVIACMLTVITYIIIHWFYRYSEELFLRNRICITKKYTIKLVYPENMNPVYLVDSQKHLDMVSGYVKKSFRWYIIGERGYYVVNRISGVMVSYENLDSIPEKYKRKFKIIEYEKY